MPANGGDSSQCRHVPFSKAPCDLTRFIEKIRDQAVGRGGFADVWKCTLSKEDINEERELVRKFHFCMEDVVVDVTP